MMIASPGPLRIPSELRAAAEMEGPRRIAWLGTLSERVADISRRWQLSVGPPFEPGGSCAWVAPAADLDGRDLVLKVGWTHTEALHEAEGLAAFGGAGAAQVHAYEHGVGTAADTTIMLLERCRPGTQLRDQPEAEHHVVITDLLHQLRHIRLEDGHPFRPLTSMCDEWADRAELTARASGPAGIDAGLLRDGLELFRALPRAAEQDVLLCTALHAGNVLSGTRQPWLLIDPKPYLGDPHYDVLQHLLNCGDTLRADPVGLLTRVADLADLDAQRVREWLFARCVQESPTWPDLAAIARRLAP